MTNGPRKRGKYGRPCDRCASRRIRCVPASETHCKGCLSLGVECTQNRVRKKAGPKSGSTRRTIRDSHPGSYMQEYVMRTMATEGSVADMLRNPQLSQSESSEDTGPVPEMKLEFDMPVATPDGLEAFQMSATPHKARLSVQKLLSKLQVYQTWFYGCWPVLSVADLVSNISDGAQIGFGNDYVDLTEKNAMAYALACSVCAAITTQISFVSSGHAEGDVHVGASEFAEEARRVRNLFDYTAEPSVNTLLSSFFLYCHYINNKGKAQQAIVYLREAICIAQILGFHDPACYEGKTRAEVHRWRKIYYTLVVTERYMGFEDAMPVVLDSCIPFPDLANEEYPSLLYGFTELIRVFSVPNKNFFGDINSVDQRRMQSAMATREGILTVQKKLDPPREFSSDVTTSQKLNVVLSKSWIRAIAWRLTSNSGMVQSSDGAEDCFSYRFPLRNARDFLAQTQDLPDLAYETNGPGVCIKLLELAKSLTFSLENLNDQPTGLPVLENLFNLINKFRNDVTLPMSTYREVANTLANAKMKHVPRSLSIMSHPGATIEELGDDDSNEGGSDSLSVFGDIMPTQGQPTPPNYLAEFERDGNADLIAMYNMRFMNGEEPPQFQSPYHNQRFPQFSHANQIHNRPMGSNSSLSSLLGAPFPQSPF